MRAGIIRNYCIDCEWTASRDDHSRDELASLAVKHAVETGHDIDSDLQSTETASPARDPAQATTSATAAQETD